MAIFTQASPEQVRRAIGGQCAVFGCERRGLAKTCPHDGRFHSHGRIHYWGDHPKHSLQFRSGGWFLICDEHYQVVKKEREEFESKVK